jgi:CubicO group peptidase (beta-lactamase class C family)
MGQQLSGLARYASEELLMQTQYSKRYSPARKFATTDKGLTRRTLRALTSFSTLAQTLTAIAMLGAGWLVWDIVTDGGASLRGDRFQRVDKYVADQIDGSRIPGASVAIVENGAVVHAIGFGEDGRHHKITADTPFWIGSNTKSITALAVMQLVEAGSIDLDAPVRKYLPKFRVADERASAQITVRHLLNQTSGISRHDGLRAVVKTDKNDSLQDVVANMSDVVLNRPVGERFEYANLNSAVLGAIIETVTGKTWQEYVKANIFNPLHMNNTYTDQVKAKTNGLTATYRNFFGFPIQTGGEHLTGLAPTGYIYSSANDMARYLSAYTSGGILDGQRVLSKAGIDAMLTPATNKRTFPLQGQKFTARYGAGWFIGPFGTADDARWHQGSLPNFTAWMVVLPNTSQAVMVMLNEGNQFELGPANTAWSRIPQGVVNILRNTDPPTGTGSARFFIVFDTIIALIVVAQAWTLTRIATRPRSQVRFTLRQSAPLIWELIIAPLMLIGYPAVAGGLGWRVAFSFVPDLTLTVLAIGGLAVLTGVVRSDRLYEARSQSTDTQSTEAHPADADPTDTPVTKKLSTSR